MICCDSCPRVYHPKCLALTTLPDGDWTCPECRVCISRHRIRSRIYIFSFKITQLPVDTKNQAMKEFHTMLKYALRRMKSHPQVGFNY